MPWTRRSFNYTAEYWSYGEIRTSTGTNPSNWGYVGFLGYYTDSDNSIYVRARIFRPDLTRWLTVDPFWPSQVAYGYVMGNPINLVDPSGLFFGYGNYCGPQNGNGGTQLPINGIDACCKDHDNCLAQFLWDWCNPFRRCECDCTLALCVSRNLFSSCGWNLKCLCGALAVLDYATTNCLTCARLSPMPLPPLLLPSLISGITDLCFIFG